MINLYHQLKLTTVPSIRGDAKTFSLSLPEPISSKLPCVGGAVFQSHITRFSTTIIPVSYTHLDVYKRQAGYATKKL